MYKVYDLEEDDNKWEIERKKEKRRWLWTLVFFVVVISCVTSYNDYVKYSETTIIEIANRVYKGISLESYNVGDISLTTVETIGKISLSTGELEKNKRIMLSKDEIADLIIQLQDTSIKGIPRLKQDKLYDTYSVFLKSEGGADEIWFSIERDESLKKGIIIVIMPSKKIANYHIVEGQDLYNKIANIVYKAP
ncbi:hypothetical protein [Psychrobacillus sp. L3]|uniref:hypothetical protein n=1 Tax=Psychrobacillus sp. L3 TaxID=3236891 RepID=UPI0036F25CD5